jgi:YHS domain-containing protein
MMDNLKKTDDANSQLSRRSFIKGTIAAGFISSMAFTPSYAKDAIYTSFLNNKAISGYDAVSYFQESGPKEGLNDFKLSYMDADWYFTSQENLDLFTANPEKYAPQYGGYCAYAVALGSTAKGDPLQWHVENEKLYLNVNKSIKKKWLADIDGYLEKSEKNWPNVIK